MPQQNQNNTNNNNNRKVIKVAGYAKRKFFDGGIEYRDFSDDLVGLQLTDDGGSSLFTMGNFKVTTNLSPKLNKTYNQGTYSDFYDLDSLDDKQFGAVKVQKNQKAGLNLDITNPLSYILYGSSEEKIRVSLEYIQEYFPAAIYVDNKIGAITGNNITDYVYDNLNDETSFTVSTNYFTNPFGINYTLSYNLVPEDQIPNPLRNLTVNYNQYVIEHNGISKKIKSFSGSTTKTNATLKFVVEGNPFPEITGLNFSQFTFLNPTYNASIPFFVKPNELKCEEFFSGLNDLEKNLLNRDVYPIYTATFSLPKETTQGVIVYSDEKITFPVLTDGYNLNFFDGIYITYLDEITSIGETLDKFKTDIIKRKYTAEVITGFDTIPRGDGGEDMVIDGAKATKLLRIYGVEFDEVKKYIDGIKFAHVVTYDKKNNTPDSLVKDLANMLGFSKFDFLTNPNILNNVLPSNGKGLFSGTSTPLSLEQIDIELYRRLILNVAWLWKSKGTRKAIEFLFRFIGAPESLVNFNEHIVIADKPVNIPHLKSLLYLYTGSSNLKDLPFDDDGYPLPIPNGGLVLVGFDNTTTPPSPIYETNWFQKSGGWYRETGGLNPPIDITEDNNPHAGVYDGGAFYLEQFLTCPFPNEIVSKFITLTGNTLYENQFINYNDGFINGTMDNDILYITPVSSVNNQIITEGIDIDFTVVSSPATSGGTTIFEQLCTEALEEYNEWVELIKENCELIYSPEWFRVQQNYIVAKNNLNREQSSRGTGINEALEICINVDCENIEVIENPCDHYEMINEDGFIYFVNENGKKVFFEEFPQCCVSAGGEYYTYVNQKNQKAFFCASESPCIGNPISSNGEAILFEVEGVNAVPDNIISITTPNNDRPTNDARRTTENELCKENSGSNTLNGCFQLTEQGEYYFGFKTKPNEEDFSTKISPREAPFVVYDKNNNPVGYIPQVPGMTLFTEGIVAINYVKSNGGIVYPSYQSSFGNNSESSDPQQALDKYVNNIRQGGEVPSDFYKYFTSVDCDKKNTTYESSIECCTYHGFDHYYVNITDPTDGSVRQVVYCRPKDTSATGDLTQPSTPGLGDILDPGKEIDKEIEVIEREKEVINKKISEEPSLSSKQKTELTTQKLTLEQRTLDLNSQKQKMEVSNRKTMTPANEKGFNKYVEGSNLNAVKTEGDQLVVGKDPKGVYTQGVDSTKPNNPTTDFGSPFSNPDLMDSINWEVASVDQYGRITFIPIDRNYDDVLSWELLAGEGADLYKECCLLQGYTFGEFQINPQTNELIPYNGQPNEYTNGSTFYACVDNTTLPCTELKDVKLVFGSNGNNGFFLPENTESNEVTIKFDYMIKYNAEELINCANIEVCKIPLDLYNNSIYNLDCRNFIVFTQTEDNKNILKDNINYIDSDVFAQNDFSLNSPNVGDLVVSELDGIPNLIPYWSTQNLQVWQTPGLQQQIDVEGDCCKAFGGNLLPIEQWGPVNEDNVYNIRREFNIAIKAISNNTRQPEWVTPEMYSNFKLINDNLNKVNKIIEEGCLNYTLFTEDNFCDDFERLITTEKVCALLTPLELGVNSEMLKEYWKLINQLLLMQKELEICVERKEGLSKIIEEVDKEMVLVEVEKETKRGDYRKTETNLENDLLTKQREILEIDDTLTNLRNQNTAIDVVKQDNLPKLDCNLYQQQIKEAQSFNVEEFCRNQPQPTTDNPDEILSAFNTCVNQKRFEIEQEVKKYQRLFESCVNSNVYSEEITRARVNNDTITEERFTEEYNTTLKQIDELQATIYCEDISELNESLRTNKEQENNIEKNVDVVANILGVEPTTIRNGNTTDLTTEQKVEVTRVANVNKTTENKLLIQKEEKEQELRSLETFKTQVRNEFKEQERELDENLTNINNIKENIVTENNNTVGRDCCKETLNVVRKLVSNIKKYRNNLYYETEALYQGWYLQRFEEYKLFVNEKMATAFEYMDELNLNFNIEVDNTSVGSQPPNQISSNLTTLPIMGNSNPIWTFQPKNYSGVVIGGSQYNSNLIEDSITTALIQNGYPGLDAVFEPQWQNFEMTLPQNVIDNLRQSYPNKQFYISLELENYECSVCLLIDNIQINYKTYDILPFYNTEGCGLPELSCVIDNRKSWVYKGDTINPVTHLPDGECQKNEVTCATPLQITAQNRLWQNLEYRYTEYDFNHSDLIINSKSAAFQIDPSKSIECDVYNFWRNIDCDECPTSCTSGESITYEGKVQYTASSYTDYSVVLSGTSAGGFTGDCNTYVSLLNTNTNLLKEEYYVLTADYSQALSAGYTDFINIGGSIDTLNIVENDCQGDTIVLGNRFDLNEEQRLIVEDSDGTVSLWGLYVYTGSTPYSGGDINEVISGVSAQTFNQTSGMTEECCESLNKTLSSKGKKGLSLDKNYVWDTTLSGCTWREINDGQGDCTHCGNTTESSFTATSSGLTCEVVNKTICVNPVDFLDTPPSQIKVKEVFDEMVQRNLINAQNRQTLSGYPTLKLFYELYLNATNCGKDYSGKLTYNNLFQFMDLIGDYWLELIEQVIPSTTIMEGCENSGKVYRNTIFDNNKFTYKKYSLNFLEVTNECNVSGVTNNSIGQETVDVAVEEVCLGGGCLGQSNKDCEDSISVLQGQIDTLQSTITSIDDQLQVIQLAITSLKSQNNSNNTSKETSKENTFKQREDEKAKKEENNKIKEEVRRQEEAAAREQKARDARNQRDQLS